MDRSWHSIRIKNSRLPTAEEVVLVVSAFILAAGWTAGSLWCILLSGHPGRRKSASLAMPLREVFQRDYRFANLFPLLA